MADNELSIKKEGLVSLMQDTALGEILKPLTREIHLFDSFVAGTSHLKDPGVLDGMEPGCKLTLRREENKFDVNAILLLSESGKKVGYVPERDNIIFARLMDAGKLLSATVTAVEKKGTFTQIAIGIYLVDF